MKKALQKYAVVFLTASFILGTLLVFTGCGEKETASSGGKEIILNEVAHSIFYAPMYVAIEEGYFEDAGLDVTLVTGYGADKTMTALLTGEADIGFMGPETTIYTYQGGTEDYAVNFAQLTQRAGNFLVSRSPLEKFDYNQLNGCTVLGGRAGGMPEMVFEYILRKNGLDPSKDLIIDQSIEFGSTAAAFSGGQGDFTVEFEPSATALEQKGDGYVITSLGEDSGYVPYTVFSARKSYLEEHPDIIQAFTDALQKGMDYVAAHSPSEIAKVIQPQFAETDLETLVLIIERYHSQDTWKQNLIFEEDGFDLLQMILMDGEVISEESPYADLVNTSFAQNAVK
ncbi:MAG: ABC transporter substrate-binding protein [Lachnospiraceae bacterium]|nr:ABC transporter substrate-binding protein [Lachnospiraceae bacterium]